MSEQVPSSARRRARMWWIVGAVAVVIVAVAAIGVATGWGARIPAPSSSATSDPATSETTEPSPSDSASPGSSSPEPTAEPGAPRQTAPPVALDETAEPVDGVSVRLTSITAISGEASVPGEVAGPALEVTVSIENAGTHDEVTDTIIVNVYYGPERTPANILVRPRVDLPASIAAGESAEGVYAFSVPKDARGQVVVEVDLSVELPVVLFEGPVA